MAKKKITKLNKANNIIIVHVTTSHDSVPKAHDKSHDQYPSQGNFNNNNNVEVTPKMILPFLKWIMYKTRLSLSLVLSATDS